jgi:hypothetical protein
MSTPQAHQGWHKQEQVFFTNRKKQSVTPVFYLGAVKDS